MGYFSVFLQKADNGFVQSCKMIVSFVFTGVVDGTTVEYEAAAVAGRVIRNSFFIRETDDPHFQCTFLEVVRELFQFGQLTQDMAEVRIFGIIFLEKLPQVLNGKRNTLDEVRLLFEVTAESVGS